MDTHILSDKLRDTCLLKLQRQKQQEIERKLTISLRKKERIRAIQEEAETKARHQEKQMKSRIDRSAEIRNNNLKRLKEKWHARVQYEEFKAKQHRDRQKQTLKQAWLQSRKLQQKIISPSRPFCTERNLSKCRQKGSGRLPSLKLSHSLAKIDNRVPLSNQNELEKSQLEAEEWVGQKKEFKRSVNDCRPVRIFQLERQYEESKIMAMGLKMDKIQKVRENKSRMGERKVKKLRLLNDYRLHKSKVQREQNRARPPHQRAKTEGSQTAGTDQCTKDQPAARQCSNKWEYQNKLRQVQMFDSRIDWGYSYLACMQQRCTRKKLLRELQHKAVQKKLYLQRLNSLQFSSRH